MLGRVHQALSTGSTRARGIRGSGALTLSALKMQNIKLTSKNISRNEDDLS